MGFSPNVGFGPGRMRHFMDMDPAIVSPSFNRRTLEPSDVLVYGQGLGLGEEETIAHYRHFRADLLIAQYDSFALSKLFDAARKRVINLVGYFPMDFDFLPLEVGEKLSACFYLVAMCKYAERMLRRASFTDVRTISHGVNTSVFYPIDYPKERLHAELGFPGADFVISCGPMMNKGLRSNLPEMLEGCKIFQEQNPDVRLGIYMHCFANVSGGHNLPAVAKQLGLQDRVRFADPYMNFIGYDEFQMSKIYNAVDVCVYQPASIGFGLPIIEAQSCGCPVVGPNWQSGPELMEAIPELLTEPQGRYWTSMPWKYVVASPERIADKLEIVLNKDPKYYRKRCSEFVHRRFSWRKHIGPAWCILMNDLEAMLDEKCLRVPEPSEELKARAAKVVVW